MRVKTDTLYKVLIGCVVACVVLGAVGSALELMISRAEASDHPSAITFDTSEAVATLTFKVSKADGTIGYGINYGPYENRQSIVMWNHCGEYSLEHASHGVPESDHTSVGPVEFEYFFDISEMMGKLKESDECVAVRP